MTRLADDESDLVEHLIGLAMKLTRDQYLGPNRAALHDALDQVRTLADGSSHVKLALAQVAEAFLRMHLRGYTGKLEVLVYRFLEPDASGVRRGLLRDSLSAVGSTVCPADHLVTEGVLYQSADGKYRVRPSMRDAVRDAVEPPVLRHWEWMERIRKEASTEDDPVVALAGRLGCTRNEAADHLRRFPLKEKQ